MLTEKINREQLKNLPKPLGKGQRIVSLILTLGEKEGPHGITVDEAVQMLDKKGVQGHWGTKTARFHEMVEAGMLTPTSKSRVTVSGGMACVYLLRKGASLVDYATRSRRKKISAEECRDEKAVLGVYRILRRQWATATQKQRERLALKLAETAMSAAQAAAVLAQSSTSNKSSKG